MSAQAIYLQSALAPSARRVAEVAPSTIRALAPQWDTPYIAVLDGEPVLRADWELVVEEGRSVAFVDVRAMPQGGGGGGGGSDPLRTIAMLAVLVMAPEIAGALEFSAMGVAGMESFVLAGGQYFSAGVAIAGMSLVNAVLPPPKPPTPQQAAAMAAPSPTYSINAQGNMARIDSAVPEHFGRLQFYPDFAGQPYSEFINNEQYSCQILTVGVGEYTVDAIKLLDTPIQNFEDVKYEVLAPGAQPTLVIPNVASSQEVSGQELVCLSGTYSVSGTTCTINLPSHGTSTGRAVVVSFTSGGFNGTTAEYTVVDATNPDSFTITTSSATTSGNCTVSEWRGGFIANDGATQAYSLGLDFVMPKGLFYANTDGSLANVSLSVAIEIRPVDDAGAPTGSWVSYGTVTYSGATATAQRKSERYGVMPGRHEVRVRRTTAKNTDTKYGYDVMWAGLRAYLVGPTTYPDVTTIAVRMRASNNLSVVNSRRIAVDATRKLPVKDESPSVWTQRTLPVNSLWTDATFGNGIFAAIAYNRNHCATSTDGVTWVQRSMPTTAPWNSIAYGNGTFAVVTAFSDIAATSPDGVTWTQRTLPASATWSVTFGNGIFVAVANNTAIAATSTDGVTWTQRTLPANTGWYRVVYGNGRFVALSSTTSIAATSTDGVNWTQATPSTSTTWYSVAFGNGVFVAVANGSATAATSTDGINWTNRSLPASAGWRRVTYGNGVFVAVADSSDIAATSADGIVWKGQTLPASGSWQSIAYGNGVFAALSYGSSVAASGVPSQQFSWGATMATRNPAWAIAYACKRISMADGQIDLAGLSTLASTWASRGDNFDGRFDNFLSWWEAISKIAQAGRAKPFMQGGVLRVVRDQAASIPVAMFSQRNIVKGSFSVDYLMPTPDTADAVDVGYFDSRNWKPMRTVAKFGNSVAAKPAKVELFGVTSQAKAQEEGVYMAASNKLRRKLIRFATEFEGFIPSYGDLIAIQHDMPGWGQGGEAVAWNAGTNTLTVSEPPVWGSGTHYIALRKRDGGLVGPYSCTAGGSANQIVLGSAPAITPYVGQNEERTHYVFGLAETWRQPAKVLACKPSGNTVVIEAVNEDAAVHSATQGGSPAPTAYSALPAATKPVLTGLAVADAGGGNIAVTWNTTAGADHYLVEQSTDGNTWTRSGTVVGTSFTAAALYGAFTLVRVAPVGLVAGDWQQVPFSNSAGDMWNQNSTTPMWTGDTNLMWS